MNNRQLIESLTQRHEQRMEAARAAFPGSPICPDCYHPAKYHHNVPLPYYMSECEVALASAMRLAN